MLDLSAKNEPIDMLSLSTKLSEQKILDSVGGNQYLAEIVNSVPSSANVKHYADIVQKICSSKALEVDYCLRTCF